MADIVSAGTFVSAVLEQAGFLTQSQLLDSLQSYFEHIGEITYFLAICAGLTAIAVFGEYKLGRYLLIAPMLYWVAVVPRAPVDKVIWKVGGGEERLFNSQPSGDQVKQINQTEKAPADAPMNLALPFQFIVTFVSNIVNGAVDVILGTGEDTTHMFFLTRMRAMEMLVNGTIDDPALLGMYKNAMFGTSTTGSGQSTACYSFMNQALSAATPLKRENDLAQFQDDFKALQAKPQADVSADEIEELLKRAASLQGAGDEYKQLWQQLAAKNTASTGVSDDTMAFIIAHKGSADFPNVQAVLAKNGLNGATDDQIRQQLKTIGCYDMWRVITDGIYDFATKEKEAVFQSFANSWKSTNGAVDPSTEEDALCRSLAEKLGRKVDEGAACDLVPITYLYLVRNSLQESQLSDIVNRHKDRMQFVRYDSQDYDQSVLMANKNPEDWEEGPDMDQGSPDQGKSIRYVRENEGGKVYVEKQRHFIQKNGKDADAKGIWIRDQSLGNMSGDFDAAFGPSVDYDTENLRQQVFTTVMEMPYWQGTLLYIISVMYPFWSLWLLIPGRATHWFVLPLTWLWVKSWDIGYALIMVFEKILWNMMPAAAPQVLNQTNTDIRQVALPDIIAESLKLDPTYNIHVYYWVLSLTFASVPTITGALILKGRKSMLASFTSAMRDMPSRTGARAASGYGMLIMNQYLGAARRLSGSGRRMAAHRDSGLAGGGALKSAATWAAMSGMARLGKLVGMDRVNGFIKARNSLSRAQQTLGNLQGRLGGVSGQIRQLERMATRTSAQDQELDRLRREQSAYRDQDSALRKKIDGLNKQVNDDRTKLKKAADAAGMLADASGQALDTMISIYEKEKKLDSMYAGVWNKNSGRWSAPWMLLNAISGTIDEGGGAGTKYPGFEMDDRTSSTYGELIGVLSAKVSAATQITQDLAVGTTSMASGDNGRGSAFIGVLDALGVGGAAVALSNQGDTDGRPEERYGVGSVREDEWDFMDDFTKDTKKPELTDESYADRTFNLRRRRRNKNSPAFGLGDDDGPFADAFPDQAGEIAEEFFGLSADEMKKKLADNADTVVGSFTETDPTTGEKKTVPVKVSDITGDLSGGSAQGSLFSSLGGRSTASGSSGQSGAGVASRQTDTRGSTSTRTAANIPSRSSSNGPTQAAEPAPLRRSPSGGGGNGTG